MKDHWKDVVKKALSASGVTRGEVLQPLWSGYGEIFRAYLTDAPVPSVIVKYINPDLQDGRHPRGWHSDESVKRKLKSYKIEQHWYEHYATLCSDRCRVPGCYASFENEQLRWIVLEDLDFCGYPKRLAELDPNGCRPCLSWLASFHAQFMHTKPDKLWPTGTYWHLATRQQEWRACTDAALKEQASALDSMLNQCHHQTLVHGDAKVANFCFADSESTVAAVDFQYTGGGCGIRDVAYFLGSCLSDSHCHTHAEELLDHYFEALRTECAMKAEPVGDREFQKIENEWRTLYPVAWADFHRFLAGWAPDHLKINDYARQQTAIALKLAG